MKIHSPKERYNLCGLNLREFRKERELSQDALAAKVRAAGHNVTQKSISRMETGKQIVTDYEIKYLAEALDITVCQLLGLKE